MAETENKNHVLIHKNSGYIYYFALDMLLMQSFYNIIQNAENRFYLPTTKAKTRKEENKFLESTHFRINTCWIYFRFLGLPFQYHCR